jgi:hypothetical protein
MALVFRMAQHHVACHDIITDPAAWRQSAQIILISILAMLAGALTGQLCRGSCRPLGPQVHRSCAHFPNLQTEVRAGPHVFVHAREATGRTVADANMDALAGSPLVSAW